MAEYKVAVKYAKSKNYMDVGACFARFDDYGGIYFSKPIRDQMIGWVKVDYFIDDEKKQLRIARNDASGIYSVHIGKQAKACGLCPGKLAGAQFRKRYAAEISGDVITITM